MRDDEQLDEPHPHRRQRQIANPVLQELPEVDPGEGGELRAVDDGLCQRLPYIVMALYGYCPT